MGTFKRFREWHMDGQRMGAAFGGSATMLSILSATQFTPDQESLGIRAGLTIIILLAALLLGRRIADSVARVPRLIETARERRAARLGDANVVVNDEDESPDEPSGASIWLGRVVLVCLWILALYVIGGIWFADQAVSKQERAAFLDALHRFVIDAGVSLLVIILTLVLARVLQQSLVASLRRGRVNRNLVLLAGRTIFATTVIIGIVVILGIWGLGIALPVTLIGGLTVAVTFALQDILKNLVAGIYLLLEHPFIIGDQITITPYTGTVENIYIRVTALRTSDGERVLVPNGLLFSSAVVNNSFYQRRRVGLVVTLPDDGSVAISTVRQRILQTLEELPNALRTPAPEVVLTKASGGKVDLTAQFWLPVTHDEETSGALSDAMAKVRAHLPEAEVGPLEVPLPD
jgi:small-conductance mechanosensitive channel